MAPSAPKGERLGIYKAASEVAAALAKPYSGPTKEVQGSGGKSYTYIPWQESRKVLDRVFGLLGWSSKVTAIQANSREGVYVAAVEITAQMVDDESGETVTITRGAVGRSTAQASKAERDETGRAVSSNLALHDTAASAAGSDGFSKACKLFGPALGSELYDAAGGSAGGGSGKSAGGDRRPSEKQMAVLNKHGYTEEQVAGLSFKEWKGIVDAIFDNTEPEIAPTSKPAKKARKPVDDDDDIPF